MRIVLMYLGKKGAGPVYSLEFTRALLKQGVEVLAFISSSSLNRQDWKSLEDTYGKSKLFQLVEVDTFHSFFQFMWRTLYFPLFSRIIKKIRLYHPDLILATMIHPWHEIIFSLLKGRICRVKIIHDVTPHVGENSLLKRWLTKLDIAISDEWVVLTENSKKKLCGKGIPTDKVQVIPHAHFGFYNHYHAQTGNNIINYRIAFFGRICKYKGVELLLKSYSAIREKMPQLKLLIAGSGKIEGEVAEGVELFNRWIDDDEVVTLLSNVDIVVLPYIEASQSGVIPLAFSLGKPVIVTDVGGLSEQVPNACGILIPSNDVDALSKAIVEVYAHPERITGMGAAAFRYAYDYLDWEKSANLFISAFKRK